MDEEREDEKGMRGEEEEKRKEGREENHVTAA